MSDLYLITPPDNLFNKNYSILLVCPSANLKQDVQNVLHNQDNSINVYLYELDDYDKDTYWLLATHKMCDVVIIDIDNLTFHVKELVTYLISFSHTYWKTQGENILYNQLSSNRFFHCEEITALSKEKSEAL